MRHRFAGLLAALALLPTAGGCGLMASTQTEASSGVRLVVLAAASLRLPFTELGAIFERTHPATSVAFSFGGSADLVSQLQGGAPADVFASADTANMDKVASDGLVRPPVAFASNTLSIAVPPDNPAGITSLADLAKPGVRFVVCAPAVPCGAATRRMATSSGVNLQPVSEESSVTDVLNKVVTGEADAGLVYVTDVRAAGAKVRGIGVPEAEAAANTYPIAVTSASTRPDLAGQFVELVTGAEGQRVLGDAGFQKP